jgi:PKHD-type hydroxylase
MLNTYQHIFKNAIPSEYCDLIISKTPWGNTETAKVNRREQREVDLNSRVTDIYWEELLSPVGCIIQSYLVEANNIWNYAIHRLEKIQMSQYKDGGHYDWHMDSKEPVNNEQRKLSIVLLLNDDFEGGMLEIESNPNENVLKSKGDIVVFPSFLKHKVHPVTKGTRYTAVSWAYGNTFR